MDSINDVTEVKETNDVDNDFEFLNDKSVDNHQEHIETLEEPNFNGFTPIVNEHILEDEILDDLPSFNSANMVEEPVHDTQNDDLNNDTLANEKNDQVTNKPVFVKPLPKFELEESSQTSNDDNIYDNQESLNEIEMLDNSKLNDQSSENKIDSINEIDDDQIYSGLDEDSKQNDVNISQNDALNNQEKVGDVEENPLSMDIENINEPEKNIENINETENKTDGVFINVLDTKSEEVSSNIEESNESQETSSENDEKNVNEAQTYEVKEENENAENPYGNNEESVNEETPSESNEESANKETPSESNEESANKETPSENNEESNNDSKEQNDIEKNNDNVDKDDSDENNGGETSKPLLEKYGDNLTVKEYVCNPAIGRDNEIKQLILTLLTPEKSAILVGKPGIGKTAIVEGLSYQIKRGNVPTALNGYTIYKLNTSSLLGVMPETNEPKIQVLLNELKGTDKLILFIDEIHTLIGAGAEGGDSLDFANIFKPGLDRGSIKVIGATTSDEYDRYILTDKAFVRRFQKIEVLEPTKEHTVKILMGSLPKLEHKTGAKLKYTPFIQEKIMQFIVDITSEYRRVYELSARYPDVSLTILQQAFSYAVFDNKKEVSIRDVRKAIVNTKLVYPDVIKKELIRFNEIFSDIYRMETVQRLKGETSLHNE